MIKALNSVGLPAVHPLEATQALDPLRLESGVESTGFTFVCMLCHPGVDFTNILLAAFSREDPKSAKRQSNHQCLFALFGSWHKKSCSLVILTPGVNFTNVLSVASIYLQFVFVFFWQNERKLFIKC